MRTARSDIKAAYDGAALIHVIDNSGDSCSRRGSQPQTRYTLLLGNSFEYYANEIFFKWHNRNDESLDCFINHAMEFQFMQ